MHYSATSLDASSFRPDPIEQFSLWFAEATSAFAAVGPTAGEANAMCLATSTPSGIPSARMVLLKGYSRAGFVWYTHYGSRKGAELASNPRAAAVFWWPPLERSVRIEGVVERLSDAENDEYFARRPAISRLGAAASEQSRPVDSREAMTDRWDALCAKHLDEDGNVVEEIRRPEGWGGYRLSPSRMEFWKGREARMHDRIEYEREGDRWSMRRLQP